MQEHKYRFDDPEYIRICKKLGFEPIDYQPEVCDYEDDNMENPLNRITIEEGFYLYRNGYM